MKRSLSSEIERKFILRSLPPELEIAKGRLIKKGFLSVEPDREVHLQSIEDRFFLTAMTGHGLSRGELETEITRVQFLSLWPLTSGRRIEKLRFEYTLDKQLFHIDIFQAELDGLRLAETEFANVQNSRQFMASPFFGDEITDDWRFTDKMLAMQGMPEGASLEKPRSRETNPYRGFSHSSAISENQRMAAQKRFVTR